MLPQLPGNNDEPHDGSQAPEILSLFDCQSRISKAVKKAGKKINKPHLNVAFYFPVQFEIFKIQFGNSIVKWKIISISAYLCYLEAM
jgi:hypothetical protein